MPSNFTALRVLYRNTHDKVVDALNLLDERHKVIIIVHPHEEG